MVINAGCCVAGTCRGGLSTVEVEVIKDDLETVVVVTVSMFQILYIHLRHDSLFDFTFHIKFNFTFRGCFHFELLLHIPIRIDDICRIGILLHQCYGGCFCRFGWKVVLGLLCL